MITTPQGHGEPCYYCEDPCNGYAADPGRWPVGLSHPDDPGVLKWHHHQCVFERLHPSTDKVFEKLVRAARRVAADQETTAQCTPAISDDVLKARVFLMNDVCTWLAANGLERAAAVLHEGRNRFLLAPQRSVEPDGSGEYLVTFAKQCAAIGASEATFTAHADEADPSFVHVYADDDLVFICVARCAEAPERFRVGDRVRSLELPHRVGVVRLFETKEPVVAVKWDDGGITEHAARALSREGEPPRDGGPS